MPGALASESFMHIRILHETMEWVSLAVTWIIVGGFLLILATILIGAVE